MVHKNSNLSDTEKVMMGAMVAVPLPICFYVMGMELLEHFVPSASRWTLEGIAVTVLMLVLAAFVCGVKAGEIVTQEP